jgi:hypothetical protein
MEDVPRSKGLYQITLGKQLEPTDDKKKFKWANKNDEARGLIEMFISPDLRFHLQGIDAPDAASEISLIRLIKIFATVLLLQRADLIHWGFLDAFQWLMKKFFV